MFSGKAYNVGFVNVSNWKAIVFLEWQPSIPKRPFFLPIRNLSLAVNLPIFLFFFLSKTNIYLYKWSRLTLGDNIEISEIIKKFIYGIILSI